MLQNNNYLDNYTYKFVKLNNEDLQHCPKAFHLYNKFMEGLDLYDGHCNNVLSSICSKKWTWPAFMRLIQASIVNALVIYNAAGYGKNKVGCVIPLYCR